MHFLVMYQYSGLALHIIRATTFRACTVWKRKTRHFEVILSSILIPIFLRLFHVNWESLHVKFVTLRCSQFYYPLMRASKFYYPTRNMWIPRQATSNLLSLSLLPQLASDGWCSHRFYLMLPLNRCLHLLVEEVAIGPLRGIMIDNKNSLTHKNRYVAFGKGGWGFLMHQISALSAWHLHLPESVRGPIPEMRALYGFAASVWIGRSWMF